MKPKTIDSYEDLLRSRILPTFGDTRLAFISTMDIETWIATMSEEGLSASRIHNAKNLLSGSLKAAVVHQLIPTNPATAVQNMPRRTKREQLYLTAGDVEHLASEVPDQYRALVYVLAYCGVRSGEAYALRRSSVSVLRGELRIKESATPVGGKMVFGTTKAHQSRTVGIPATVRPVIEQHLAAYVELDPDALVFTAPNGGVINPSNFRRRVWKSAIERAGLEAVLRIHDTRHSSVSLLVNSGVPLTSVMEHVGHSSITTTINRYAHLYPGARIEATNALDKAIAAARQRENELARGQVADKGLGRTA